MPGMSPNTYDLSNPLIVALFRHDERIAQVVSVGTHARHETLLVLLVDTTLGQRTVIGEAADDDAHDVEVVPGPPSKVEGRNHRSCRRRSAEQSDVQE